jgi:carbon storage regulator
MLVLSRRSGECVRIGHSIEVKVLEISGNKVKLGFTAPADVPIQRNELRSVYPREFTAWQQCPAVAELCT